MGDSGQIGVFVRNWLHYDTLASSLYKQATRARQVKDEFEVKIIDDLRSKHMENAVIQINSGIINIVEERSPRTLSLVRIEEILHKYFLKKGAMKDDTAEIMNFIRTNRGYDVSKKLRKSGAAPLPPPPQLLQSQSQQSQSQQSQSQQSQQSQSQQLQSQLQKIGLMLT